MQKPTTEEVVDESVVKIPKPQLSRLLYCNPVCILTMRDTNVTRTVELAKSDERQLYNAMTISWLTPINNHGLFVCSMNSRRYTASLLVETKAGFDAEKDSASKFVLSVPTKRLEGLVLNIGGCSGWRHVPPKLGKLRHLGVETCKPGWGYMDKAETIMREIEAQAEEKLNQKQRKPPSSSAPPEFKRRRGKLPKKMFRKLQAFSDLRSAMADTLAIRDCVAHMICVVRAHEMVDRGRHVLLRCEVLHGFVRSSHWSRGRNFICDAAMPRATPNETGVTPTNAVHATVTPTNAVHATVTPTNAVHATVTPTNALHGTDDALLTFLGSGRFAYMRPC